MKAIMYQYQQVPNTRQHLLSAEESEVTIESGDLLISPLGLSYRVTRITDCQYWLHSNMTGITFPSFIWNFDPSMYAGIVKVAEQYTDL